MTTVMNPFEDDKLWNNVIAENILSKLPTDIMNKIVDYIPEPKLKAQPFNSGYYCIQYVKSYSEEPTTKNPYKSDCFFKCLVKCNIIKDMPKTIQIESLKPKVYDTYPIKKEKMIKTYKKKDFEDNYNNKYDKDFMFEKYLNVDSVFYIGNPNIENVFKDIVNPWRDYYEDELIKLSTTKYSYHPR